MRESDEYALQVLAAVNDIPFGRVATYGLLAMLTGKPGRARLVGHILANSEKLGRYPCHRVVNAQGQTAPGFTAQRQLL